MPEPTAQEESRLTSEQLIRIASRLLVAYLLLRVVEDLILVPREIAMIIRYAREGSKAAYSFHQWTIYLTESALRILIWLGAARWFYRCGPRIMSFFTASPPAVAWWETSLKDTLARRNEVPRMNIDRDQ